NGEDPLKPFDLDFGLVAVLFERRAQFLVLSCLGHFREGGQNLLLREIDVLQRIVKKLVYRLRFFSHRSSPLKAVSATFTSRKTPTPVGVSDLGGCLVGLSVAFGVSLTRLRLTGIALTRIALPRIALPRIALPRIALPRIAWIVTHCRVVLQWGVRR